MNDETLSDFFAIFAPPWRSRHQTESSPNES
jgi:hypothetical protein